MEDKKIVQMLWDRLEQALEELAKDGTIEKLAKKYGVENTVITDFADQK